MNSQDLEVLILLYSQRQLNDLIRGLYERLPYQVVGVAKMVDN